RSRRTYNRHGLSGLNVQVYAFQHFYFRIVAKSYFLKINISLKFWGNLVSFCLNHIVSVHDFKNAVGSHNSHLHHVEFIANLSKRIKQHRYHHGVGNQISGSRQITSTDDIETSENHNATQRYLRNEIGYWKKYRVI